MLLLARLAKQWHCRPSELLNSSSLDFQIDVAAAVALWETREEDAEDVIDW